ncbi:hypothetical protein QO259_08695 [Salinicola sp. JS01]|uniref:hypothetical protein n=1 Tax=Salinicola sp. JS01 TaxID=3050071 RepID=UPI00255C24C8|nr:hypothetical protein [Salinicola sp. JS01]WIX34702.1 hypothetical protein QO259_08695 [Salinicola sp. JS01]
MHSRASADAVSFTPFAALFGTSTSGETKQLTVIFDDNDVVSNYLMNATDSGIKTGVYSNQLGRFDSDVGRNFALVADA